MPLAFCSASTVTPYLEAIKIKVSPGFTWWRRAASIRGAGPANDVTLYWTATQTIGSYKLYGTQIKNNDGNPDNGADPDWTLITSIPAPAAPGRIWCSRR